MRSTRLAGLLVFAVALFGGLITLVGPTFSFETRGAPKAWVFSENHVTLAIAPALAGMAGAVLLLLAAGTALGRLGGLVALTGGVWFVIAPSLERLWSPHSLGIAGTIGAVGTPTVRTLESVGYAYGTGALLVALAAFAIGRPRLRTLAVSVPAGPRTAPLARPAAPLLIPAPEKAAAPRIGLATAAVGAPTLAEEHTLVAAPAGETPVEPTAVDDERTRVSVGAEPATDVEAAPAAAGRAPAFTASGRSSVTATRTGRLRRLRRTAHT